MKRIALGAIAGLILSLAAHAANPSNASLKGAYFIQMTTVKMVGWSKSFSITCYGTKFTVGVSGQALDTELITGMVTFTGTGTFSGSVTQSGEFDQTASANTTTVTCSGSAKSPGYITNTGYAVYDAPSTSSASGTYTVASAGTGTMMVQTGQGEAPLVLSLGDFNSANVAGVVLLTKTAGDEWEPSVGTAVLK
jgi:hypothetical protein